MANNDPSHPHSWLERWMLAHDVAPGELPTAIAQTRARSARFPFPVNRFYPAIDTALDVAAPSLMLHRLMRARSLDEAGFDELEHKLQLHPNLLVRMLYVLARHPGLEQLYPDEAPEPAIHPLEKMKATIRLQASHRERHFDVVVIGSGAGGAPVAWSLARAGYRVAIVESGELITTETTGGAVERYYLNQGMVGSMAAEGMTLVMAGNAVGGTTAINSGTSLRPKTECLERWDAMLGTSFAAGLLDPWMDQVHEQIGITVSDRSLLDESARLIERGLHALGRTETFVLPRNAPRCVGAARCCFGCPSGAKQSTDRAYLPSAIEYGASLFSGTRATQIREDRHGVEVFVRGKSGRRSLRARSVVIAAGALNTPHLIRANRLGDRWRKAGSGLRIHPATKVFALMPDTIGHDQGVPQGIGYRAPELPRLTFEGVHTPPSVAAPLMPVPGRRHRWWMDRYERVASFGMMCRDRTTGSVRGVGPHRHINYSLHSQDARDLGAGVLLVAEAFFAAGAERLLLPVNAELDPEVRSLEELGRYRPEDFTTGRIMTSGFHPQGTAGMGRVVDTDLALHGTNNIFVCDASVLPDSPGVNPQVTLMALGLRLADHLTETFQGAS